MRAVEGSKKDARPERETKGDGKPKRVRKRPPLAAVPDGEGDFAAKKGRGSRAPVAPLKQLGEAVQAASASPPKQSPAAPAAGSSPSVAAKGKRRELPPYLRVVK
jgi:hypothetical protein